MTIKQQGGIFGRNPTFSDVSAKSLTVTDSTPRLQFVDADDTNQVAQIDFGFGHVDIKSDINNVRGSSRITFQIDGSEVGRWDSNGNLVIAGAGNGIDFSATSGTGTSELFSDYEEGTWTPVVADAASGGNASASSFTGDYTKVGNLVFVNCSLVDIDTTGLTAGNDLYIQGLPFTPKSGTLFAGSVFGRVAISGKWCTAAISSSPAIRLEDNPGTTSNPTRVPVSGIVDDGGDLRISITYIEA